MKRISAQLRLAKEDGGKMNFLFTNALRGNDGSSG